MPLEPFKDFLIACVGASASFIGLLFVALSVVLARGDAGGLKFSDERLAETSFTALSNVFFISLVALIPGTNIGYVALIAALFGFRNVWRLFSRLRETRKKEGTAGRTEDIIWIVASVIVYAVEAVYAVRIILNPADIANLYIMMSILATLFGTALVRTWELTGVRAR